MTFIIFVLDTKLKYQDDTLIPCLELFTILAEIIHQ